MMKRNKKQRQGYSLRTKQSRSVITDTPFVKNSATFASNKVLLKAHSKIREVEHENSSVEAAHKTEEQAERFASYSMRLQKNLSQKRKKMHL